MSDRSTSGKLLLGRFAWAYIVLAAVGLHVLAVAAWQYERMTCDPTEFFGCFGVSLLESAILFGVLGLALLAAVVVIARTLLEAYYGGASA